MRACAVRGSRTRSSVGRAGGNWPEAMRERILACEEAICDRYLSSPRDAELLAKDIAVRLRRSRGDPESLADLLVGATGGNQLDHLALAIRDARGDLGERFLHGWRR